MKFNTSTQDTTTTSHSTLKESNLYCRIPQTTRPNLSMMWVKDSHNKLTAYWS